VRQVSPVDGRLRLLRYCGPDFGRFRRFRGSGFRDVEQHEPSPFELAECRNADVTRSCATRPLDGRLLSFPAHNMGTIHCANLRRNSANRDFPPTVDLLLWMDPDHRQYNLCPLTCLEAQKRFFSVLRSGASHATCRPEYSRAQTRNVTNIRLHGG
jgi:hypothetical protein